jgi:DNA repair exonuclease SbcCD ATPase subunit
MMDELKQLQSTQQQRESLELASLRKEVEALRGQLTRRDQEQTKTAERTAREAAASAESEAGLRREIDSLRSDINALGGRPGEVEAASDEAGVGEEAVESQNDRAELPPFDLSNLEAQLSEFRRLLQADRHSVEEDVTHLQTHRGGELNSKPPSAPLAGEMAQLNQLRREIRQEIDRLQSERPGILAQGEAPAQPPKKNQTPTTKSRGTFLGIRRWLTGG